MKRRRGNGEGTVTRRQDGRWMAQLSYVDKAGRRRRWTAYAKTRKEADEKLTRAKAELQHGTFVEPSRLTVGQWLDTWLEEYKRPVLRALVYEGYRAIIKNHLQPALGSIRLQHLKPEDMQRLYNNAAERGLSAGTIRRIHAVLNGALKQAIRNRLLVYNPCDAVALPKGKKNEPRALTIEEQQNFLKALEGERLRAAFLVLLFAGLRRSEVLALTWQDVDLENRTLQVRQDLVRSKGKGLVFQEPKSKTSRRVVPLPDRLVAELKAHKARQAQEKLLAGPAYEDNGLVFATQLGTPIEPRNLNRLFYRLREKAGLPDDVNLHALRHTYATRLLEEGVAMKTVQALLGHSDYRVTADVYSHVQLEIERKAADRLDRLLKEASFRPEPKGSNR